MRQDCGAVAAAIGQPRVMARCFPPRGGQPVRGAQPVAQPAQTLVAALAERRERETHRVLADVGEQIDRHAPPGPQLRHEAVFAWEARRFLRFAARLAIGTARGMRARWMSRERASFSARDLLSRSTGSLHPSPSSGRVAGRRPAGWGQ